MSKAATREKKTGNEQLSNSCCGGPAPTTAKACCVQDADAKAAGATGCGCDPTTDPKRICCP